MTRIVLTVLFTGLAMFIGREMTRQSNNRKAISNIISASERARLRNTRAQNVRHRRRVEQSRGASRLRQSQR